jgi:hypothetical protein
MRHRYWRAAQRFARSVEIPNKPKGRRIPRFLARHRIEPRGGASVNEPQVVVHDRVQAEAALAAAEELGCAIWLRSAPDAAGYAGVGYLKALGDALGHEIVVDCGDDAGLVMAALRTGCRRLAFSGPAAVSQRLGEMAAEVGAWYRHETQAPGALCLSPDDDARSRCRAWLCDAKAHDPAR